VRCSSRFWLVVSVAISAVAIVLGSSAASTADRRASRSASFEKRSPALVPNGDLVAISLRGRVLVLDRAGREVKVLPGRIGPDGLAQAIQLAPDRRHAWVSVWNSRAQVFWMYSIDLSTGRRRRLVDGVSPTLNPDETELAYIGFSEFRTGGEVESELVIENLADGRTRVTPFGLPSPIGNSPQLIISWSPNGRQIAVDAGGKYRLVNVRKSANVVSSPSLPGVLSAPAYLSADTIVADANCCTGAQRLVAIDLHTDRESTFARLSSPVQTVQRVGRATLLMTDALDQLVTVSKGRVRLLREGIAAVSP
jgi:hypothetical protein